MLEMKMAEMWSILKTAFQNFLTRAWWKQCHGYCATKALQATRVLGRAALSVPTDLSLFNGESLVT